MCYELFAAIPIIIAVICVIVELYRSAYHLKKEEAFRSLEVQLGRLEYDTFHLLKGLEFSGHHPGFVCACCPECGQLEDSHIPGCKLAAILRPLKKKFENKETVL